MKREKLLDLLFQAILLAKSDHPTRVAIDGFDAAGKTTLADQLATFMSNRDHHVLRASIDGFHNPSLVRYRNGESPDGYYRDSFNYGGLVERLLTPLGPGGNREYTTAVFDHRSDTALDIRKATAEIDSTLLFDGVFLLRDELCEYWDFKIFVEVSLATVIERARKRDVELFGSVNAVVERYQNRYIPGQLLYEGEVNPRQRADVVIDNNNPNEPQIVS